MNLLLIAIMNLLIGFLSGVLSIPLVTKGVGPNETYGFRFENSFQSDEAWYAINAYGGKWILFWSVILLGLGAFCLISYFNEVLNFPVQLKLICTFSPCFLLISGAQASIWAGKNFPIRNPNEDRSK